MKRLTALILALILVFSLVGCAVKPGDNGEQPDFTEPSVVKLSDGSVVYSKEPFVEYPQTGEYKETALLTIVPGQGVPLLLDMREDGTIDYIFADVENKADFQNFASSGARYFTIAPDGTATEQDSEWMDGIDEYMAITLETTQDPNGQWRFLFTSEDDTILILGQYHNIVQYPTGTGESSAGNYESKGKILYSALFKIVNGQVTLIPLDWEIKVGSRTFDLRSTYLSSIDLKDGQIIISKRAGIFIDRDGFFTATYNMNGALEKAEKLQWDSTWSHEYTLMDDTGLLINSIDAPLESQVPEWSIEYRTIKEISIPGIDMTDNGFRINKFLEPEEIQYTEDDSLYYLGKRVYSLQAHAQGSGKDFCCWFDEAGKGVLMRYTYNPEGKIEPEVLTVWSLEPIDTVKTAVAQWNHTHATPIFRYETATEALEGTHQTLEDEITRLHLELLNNRAPDVMILDGLNVERYMEFMTPLDRISTEGVYDSILTRFTVGDDLLAIPTRANPYLLGRLADGTEDIESLEQFADIVTATTPPLGNSVFALESFKTPYRVAGYGQLFQLWYPAWADAIWSGGKLNKDVFKEFLTHTSRLSEHYQLDSYISTRGSTRGISSYRTYEENDQAGNLDFDAQIIETDGYMLNARGHTFPYTLAAPNHVGLYTYWLYVSEHAPEQKSTPHYLDAIPGPDGTGVMVPTVVAGVRAGGNEDAGQEFVQILLSRELQLGGAYHSTTQADGYPVKWQYTEELVQRTEAYMHNDYAVQNDYREVLNHMRAVIIDETLYKMALYAAHCHYMGDARDWEIDRGLEYTALTIEEAADLLEEMSRIYLAELR